VAAGTYTLTARAFDSSGASAASTAVTVTVNAPNGAPSVTLTSPTNGATFTAPATINLAATASDPENQLARVEFLSGSTVLATDTTAPYAFTWSNVAAGTYTLTARAFDSSGASAASAAVTVTVNAPNGAPSVTLTSPTNGATFTAPATINLAATASDPENQLARVEFRSGSTVVATDTTAPYSFSWTNVPAGSYTITAVAFDAAGASTTSAAVTVTVSSAPPPPPTSVVFGASSDHATNVTRYELSVFAQGADPATATPVATSDLGKPTPAANNDITVNRASFFSALPPGNYIAVVTAIGPGGQTRSAPASFSR
jgi:predicted phage tail protein